MRNILILLFPTVMVLSGCAKMMNENQCLVADWRTVGFEDGSQGRGEQWISKRSEACSEYGVTVDLDQYLFGREQGLETFCQPRRGFDMGMRGNVYENVCPRALETDFLIAYQDGRELNDRRSEVNQLEHAVSSAYGTLAALSDDITATTVALATAPDMTNQERINYALDLKNMAEERGRIQASLPQMEADLGAARYELDSYTANIAPKYPGAI